MSQVIVYTNAEGNVCVCIPTGEVDIQTVLTKDCPPEAIIIDDSTLPQGIDNQFFDAWELNGSTVTVNLTKAKAIKLAQFNSSAMQVAQKRQLNTLSGIANDKTDSEFLNELADGRTAIANAQTTAELALITNPI
jgi:hypothetical protein